MESAAYEGGGAGGKLRKRPMRRATAPTPYDRPPTAARGGLGGIRNGWLSRLVDPASRIITGGASRLFSSVFRKPLPSLPAPPPPSDENLQLIEEDPEDACLKSLSDVQEKGKRDGKELISNSESDGISDLEQLMKQKTFTRAEFNYLTELLRTRTMESMRTEPMDDNMEVSNAEKDIGTGHTIFNGNTTPSKGGLSIPKEQASPAEIAKAYMGSRPSKLPSLRHSSQSHVSREDATLPNGVPFAVKPPDLSVAPRPIVSFPRVPEQPENGYFTPRSRGRSAIYRMSRSPYFKVQTAANVKGGMPAGESSTSSQWTMTTNLMHSGGKQGLKRGSSVLDGDFGSFGPIRRIRQKSNLMSPLKDIRKSLPENLLPSASTPLSRDALPASSSSIQKHLRFNVPRHGSGHSVVAEHDDIRSSDDGVPPIPHQSGEMARKILQQLDKLVPSPKEKSSELKATTRDESPSKLTLDMLHGQALRSIEHIGPANFVNARFSDSMDATNDSDPQRLPQKQEIQGNGPSKSVVSNAMASGPDSKFCAVTSATDAKSDKRVPHVALTESSTIPLHEKPAFKISAPEDSLEMEEDNDDFANAAALGSAANGKDKQDLKSDRIFVISETQTSEKLVASSPQSMHPTSTKLSGELDGTSSDRPAAFSFPLTSVSSTIVQPPTPTMPAPKPEISALTKVETLAPAFSSGSKDAPTTVFSLNTSDPAGFKSDIDHVSEPELSIRNTSPSTQAEGLNLDRGDKNQKASESFKSFGSSVSSDLPTSLPASTFAFGASVPSLNNGSLNPNPPAIFGSGISNSGSQSSSNLSSSGSAPSSSSSISSFSSAGAMFSTGAAFKFGSGTATSSSSSVSTILETVKTPVFKFGSGTTTSAFCSVSALDAGKTPTFDFTSTFGTSAANAESSSSTGSSSSSASSMSAPFSSANVNSAASTPSSASLFTSTVSGTAAQVGSSLFSSSGSSSSTSISSAVPSMTFGSHSSLSSSFPFSSTGNGIFGFGASAQSGDSSLTLSSTSSQNISNFGATASPIYGAQGTSSASGISNLSQSTGQLSSFSSTPTFGMTGSPSFGFSSSPFGAASSSAKPFSSSSGFTFSAGSGSSSAGSGSSFATSAAGLFGLTSQSSAASLNTAFGSSSPSAGLTFGIPASGGSTSTFGSSTGSVFSFNSAGTASTTASARPSFGVSPVASFGSGFPQNDQMSVEDSMTDDSVQTTVPTVPTFGQPASSPTPPSFMFGLPAVPSGGQPVFQFGGQNSVPPSANSFQPSGTLEFTSGGSFSLGSGGDKSTRKIVRVRRNKPGAKK
ncbi:hypothetical protein DsansV1_C13g0123891 [Dioscorea sansibarensis]